MFLEFYCNCLFGFLKKLPFVPWGERPSSKAFIEGGPATFSRRLMAATIDLLFLYIVAFPAVVIINYIFFWHTGGDIMEAFYEAAGGTSSSSSGKFVITNDVYVLLLRYAFAEIFVIIIYGAIIAFCWRKWDATPGKMITKCKVVDAESGHRMSLRQCVKRILGYIISIGPVGLGLITIAFSKRNHALHDIIAKTEVVIVPRKAFFKK